MFCSYCGTESTQGLNYCNRCGNSLSAPAQTGVQDARPAVSASTAWAVGVTMMLLVIIGLGILLGALTDIAYKISADAVAAIMVCGSLTVLGSVLMLTRLWMRLLAGTKRSTLASLIAARRAATGELGPARAGALTDATGAPISSITEHTTRTLHTQRGSRNAER